MNIRRSLGAIDKTIAKPKNNNLASAIEFKDWMILLWHVGGSSDDMANLKLANLDYSGDQPCIIYKRAKHRGTKTKMGGKTREPVKFPVEETLKALMLKRINMANQKGHELLFPLMSNKTSSARLKIFDKYLKYAGINKIKVEEGGVERSIKLHSFRYAVACRMAECGISLSDAQYYLGHNCSAVARYYAGRASVKMEPLEDIEARCKATQEAVTKVA